MNINVLASGSTGNAYIISDGQTSLLLDCGIPFRRIQEGCGFRTNDIAACLIGHEHKDHSKAAPELIRRGMDVYASAGTIETCGLSGHRVHIIKELARFEVGSFNILPFDVEHDAAEPLGFLIYSNMTGEKLLYVTDSYYIKYRFTGLTHMMIEVNYSLDILNSNIEADPNMAARKYRLLESHMSIDHLEDMLRANDLSQLRQIYLIHMSSDNGDEAAFKERIQRLTGAEVYIA